MPSVPTTSGTPSPGREPSSSSRSSSSSASRPASRPVHASAAWVTDDAGVGAPVTLRETRETAAASPARLDTHALNAYFGAVHAIKEVTLALPDRSVTAVIGPSG